MAKRFQELGVKPEIEVFAPGDILLANKMLEEGLFDAPPMYQIVMGTRWGLPATPETLIYMKSLLPRVRTGPPLVSPECKCRWSHKRLC